MKYLRYMGEFLSVAGVTWRAEIMQDADTPFEVIGKLTFDASQPLVIEWKNKSKEEVICGSVATLKIVSPGDRTYEDLYSIEVGRVRLDVYRNNTLYWSGTIDTEFYEEPYESASGYDVTLTFSDFGLLDRLKVELTGMATLYQLVSYALDRCSINRQSIDDSLISTSIPQNSTPMSLTDIKVRTDNFYDEDGEALTLAEMVEGVLQPLALRMVQRAGKVYVYDLNGLYNYATSRAIVWDGSSQTLGVDTVYNNAKITWNTYAQSGRLTPEDCWASDIPTSVSLTALNNTAGGTSGDAKYFSYHYSTDLWDWIDATDCGFTIWTAARSNGTVELGEKTKVFKIVPQYDGTESEGVAVFFVSVAGIKAGTSSGWSAQYKSVGNGEGRLPGTMASIGPMLYKHTPIWVPPVDNTSGLVVRIGVDLLVDPRFNPFESAANIMKKLVEQKDYYDEWKRYGNFLYIPVTIKFQPDDSTDVYIWDNRDIVAQSCDNPIKTLNATYGKWVIYSGDDAPNAWGYLAYYDAKDRRDTSAVLGWKTNRPAINPHDKDTISILENAEAGQYIPYPNIGGKGGKLWVEVRREGWQIANENQTLSYTEINNPKQLWSKINWVLMKVPAIEIMNNNQFDQTISTDDVEYNAEINSAAKEQIKIDTICGTSAEGVPTARGAYFSTITGEQIKALSRAGRTSQAEDLLIGTLYSQFAQRRTTLSGEAEIASEAIATYTEDNQGDKLFMLAADVQDVRADVSDAVFVELRPDEYTKQN